MSRHRTFCKWGLVGLGWGVLCTPLSTLSLLNAVAQHCTQISQWITAQADVWREVIVGSVMVGPPAVGLLIGALGLLEVRSSWRPLDGAGYTKAAIVVNGLSILCAVAILMAMLLPN